MTAELLPCPFCGLEDGCVMGNKTDYVLCLACGAQGPYVPAGRKAVKLATNDWNRRAQPPAGEVALLLDLAAFFDDYSVEIGGPGADERASDLLLRLIAWRAAMSAPPVLPTKE